MQEELKKVDQAVKEIVEEEMKDIDPLDTPELNEAAKEFQAIIPEIKKKSLGVSQKGLRRVFTAVIEFPLADVYPNLKDKKEQELFIMSLGALELKNRMVSAFNRQNKKIQESLENSEEEFATGLTTEEVIDDN